MPTHSADALALGFDIGGSNTKVGLISRYGKIVASEAFPTRVESVGLEAFLAEFLAALHAMLGRSPAPVAGIGGTFPGWVDESGKGPFLCMNAPALNGLDMRSILADEFRLPVSFIDDANAHAMAEYTYGSGRGCRRFMDLALGTGVSAGVILYGKLLQFSAGCTGDTGHVILRPGGPACSAGCKGCAEALIGVVGIQRLALEKYGYAVTARQVIQLASRGKDAIAVEVIRTVGGYVGELLASLSHIFFAERIAISGGLANAGPVLLEAVRQRFEDINGDYHRLYARHSGGYYNGVEIVLGQLKESTGMIGATVGVFSDLA